MPRVPHVVIVREREWKYYYGCILSIYAQIVFENIKAINKNLTPKGKHKTTFMIKNQQNDYVI